MAVRRHPRSHRGLGGKIRSLSERLEKFLFRQFELRHELKGDACPGEAECARSGRIAIRREDEGRFIPALSVCRGGKGEPKCEALETKPSEFPPDLSEAIGTAYELCSSKRVLYHWPDALAPAQWACVRAHDRAEAKLLNQIQEEREREIEERRQRAHLEALQNR